MSALRSEEPVDLRSPEPGTDQEQLARRATQLCLRAEPHTNAAPCAMHLGEASRQLVEITV